MQRPDVFRVPPGFEQEWDGASASATEVVLNTIRVGVALGARVDAFVRQRGLPSSTALIVLEVLRGEGGPLQPSTIAARCFLSRPALSGVLDTLERRGLLRRAGHADDRRRVEVEIASDGVELLEGILPDLHRAEAEWAAPLSERQREVLLSTLGRVHANLIVEDEEGADRTA